MSDENFLLFHLLTFTLTLGLASKFTLRSDSVRTELIGKV